MASSGDSNTYSSDEEVLRPVVKRKKKPKTIISTSESDDEDSDVEIKPKRVGKPLRYESEDENNNNQISSTSSCMKNGIDESNDLSDNEQVEKCAICLSKFLGQDIATPETCDHVFCLECLQEWAKNVNTCPIDRLKFNLILIRHHKEEKIVKTIIINNSVLPSFSDSESESIAQTLDPVIQDLSTSFRLYRSYNNGRAHSPVDCCEFCGRDKNEGATLRCHDCRKIYHHYCVPFALESASSDSWKCPECESSIWERYCRSLSSVRPIQNSLRTHSPTNSSLRSQHSTYREFRRRRRFLFPKTTFRRFLSSSDSSDEETEHRSVPSRVQSSLISSVTKSRCPLLGKRRNEICRSRNQALVSAAASAASESRSLYTGDSDDGLNDYRLFSTPVPENFDIVGTILESQTLLHRPDVLTLARDGTLLRNSKDESSPRKLPSSNTLSTLQNSEDSNQSSFLNSSFFNDNAISPFLNGVAAKQRPLNPTQNNSSKYSGTPLQAYSCGSSGAPMERSINYEVNTSSRPTIGANSNDRFGNEPCSPIIPRSFCSTSTSDEAKKDGRASKGNHSEDEVDIYSDIESVGEEEGEIVERVEPMKIAFKCDDSQISNPNDNSDSSDNELVIDEDQQVEEDNEKLKEYQESIDSNRQTSIKNSQIICESEESNVSSNAASDDDQLMIDTNPPNQNNSFVENSNDGYKTSDESSQEAFQNDERLHQRVDSNDESNQQRIDSNDESNQQRIDSNDESSQQRIDSNDESNQHKVDSNDDSNQHKVDSNDDSNQQRIDSNDDSNQQRIDYNEESNQQRIDYNDESNQQRIDYNDESNQQRIDYNDESNQQRIDYNDESNQQRIDYNDESNYSKSVMEKESTSKNESDSDAEPHESDVDIQEDEENSLDSGKKSYQGDASTPCTSLKSSPKSYKGETADGFEMQCDNSGSNENSAYCDNNSCYEEEESKEVFEEVSNVENENTCDSTSRAEETENFLSGNNSNLSDPASQVENNENFQNENNSNFSFASDQQPTEANESVVFDHSNANQELHDKEKSELVDICSDIAMKSDDEDNLDSIENASTPCLDENLDGQIENSPVRDENYEDEGQDFESASPNLEYDDEKENAVNEERIEPEESEPVNVENADKDPQENAVDLGIEDISEAGSEEMGDEFPDEASANKNEKEIDEVEQKVASLFSPDESKANDEIEDFSKRPSGDCSKHASSHSNQSFEDQEEGEIIEERPVHRCSKKKKNRFRDDSADYSEFAPRINISDLPRIPKLKRDRDKDSIPETISFENKRTSVLSRVDLGAVDISWKRLSKHTRERSYRDGRPKDERLLYRERESRNKDKNDINRKNESKNSDRRREEKKLESEKSKNDYDSRSRKSEKTKSGDWSYSDREKRKSRKDKHSKDKHSKEKKDKHDKIKHSKNDDKYEREKLKDEIRYERDMRYDKDERFERIVYEKGKFKEKEHKSKHKERKSESNKSSKDHSREKHKHTHSSDHFSDKQREREVRKIDDKLKIVVEQKESRKEKSKHKERKEAKHEKKQVLQRKIESERSPYTELTSIESKEIFAKGDSIIINVNFNRASSPKVSGASDGIDSNSKDKKALSEEMELDEPLGSDEIKVKSKHISSDKVKNLDSSAGKRPATPPEKNPVLSVSECYWQGGDDPDGNHTPVSEKSEEEACAENENETASANGFEVNNFSSNSSADLLNAPSAPKDSNSAAEEPSFTPDKESSGTASKESESFSSKRRSPRSPSPPSPADNDSYDPCEPTRSPSPPPMPPTPPLPAMNPKPPPSPELPPLPPEPEPIDTRDDPRIHKPNTSTDFVSVSTVNVSNAAQANTIHTQTSIASPISVQSMLLPPPSFLSHVSSATNNLQGMAPLVPQRNGGFQMSSHATVMLPSNHVQQVMGGNFMPPMHGSSALPPPPNPPNMPHMSSVPPPPPPPAGMTLLSQARHPRLNLQPPLTPTSLLQSLTMAHHNMAAPPMQVIHHLPPNLSGILANHQSPIVCSAQNQPTSLPVSIANQQVSRIFSQNQLLNHNTLLQNQNACDSNKSQGNSVNLMPSNIQPSTASSSQQKPEKHTKQHSPNAEKNEVIDMEVDTPYSPGDSPSPESNGDYSPTASPVPSSPKNKDVFDSLFPADQRTSEKRTHDAASGNEKSKHHSGSKKSKHDHKADSKARHSVRMQVKDKYKKVRKEHKTTEKKESLTKLEDSQLKILDELPSSAVEMQVKEKFLKKLNRQERVVEEVKLALKPYYKSRDVTKEEYKDILRKSVPKICHNKSGEINPVKVKNLVECYVKKAKHSRKKGDKRKSSKLS